MTNVSVRALLTFNTNQGQTLRMSIPRGDKSITPEIAQAAMDRIIATSAVLATAGRPTGVNSAKLISTTREVLI